MRRSFMVFALLFVAAALVLGTVSMADGTAPKASAAVSSTQTPTPQFVMPTAGKPKPTPEVVCIQNICKVVHGVLYRCQADASGNCCNYHTGQQCTVDPNCVDNIPPYCPAVPPNACPNTCPGN